MSHIRKAALLLLFRGMRMGERFMAGSSEAGGTAPAGPAGASAKAPPARKKRSTDGAGRTGGVGAAARPEGLSAGSGPSAAQSAAGPTLPAIDLSYIPRGTNAVKKGQMAYAAGMARFSLRRRWMPSSAGWPSWGSRGSFPCSPPAGRPPRRGILTKAPAKQKHPPQGRCFFGADNGSRTHLCSLGSCKKR